MSSPPPHSPTPQQQIAPSPLNTQLYSNDDQSSPPKLDHSLSESFHPLSSHNNLPSTYNVDQQSPLHPTQPPQPTSLQPIATVPIAPVPMSEPPASPTYMYKNVPGEIASPTSSSSNNTPLNSSPAQLSLQPIPNPLIRANSLSKIDAQLLSGTLIGHPEPNDSPVSPNAQNVIDADEPDDNVSYYGTYNDTISYQPSYEYDPMQPLGDLYYTPYGGSGGGVGGGGDDDVINNYLQLQQLEARARIDQQITLESVVRQKKLFLVSLIAALASYGCTTHRIEYLAYKTSVALNVRSQCLIFPNMYILTFVNDGKVIDPTTSETVAGRLGGGLDLYKLQECEALCATIYRMGKARKKQREEKRKLRKEQERAQRIEDRLKQVLPADYINEPSQSPLVMGTTTTTTNEANEANSNKVAKNEVNNNQTFIAGIAHRWKRAQEEADRIRFNDDENNQRGDGNHNGDPNNTGDGSDNGESNSQAVTQKRQELQQLLDQQLVMNTIHANSLNGNSFNHVQQQQHFNTLRSQPYPRSQQQSPDFQLLYGSQQLQGTGQGNPGSGREQEGEFVLIDVLQPPSQQPSNQPQPPFNALTQQQQHRQQHPLQQQPFPAPALSYHSQRSHHSHHSHHSQHAQQRLQQFPPQLQSPHPKQHNQTPQPKTFTTRPLHQPLLLPDDDNGLDDESNYHNWLTHMNEMYEDDIPSPASPPLESTSQNQVQTQPQLQQQHQKHQPVSTTIQLPELQTPTGNRSQSPFHQGPLPPPSPPPSIIGPTLDPPQLDSDNTIAAGNTPDNQPELTPLSSPFSPQDPPQLTTDELLAQLANLNQQANLTMLLQQQVQQFPPAPGVAPGVALTSQTPALGSMSVPFTSEIPSTSHHRDSTDFSFATAQYPQISPQLDPSQTPYFQFSPTSAANAQQTTSTTTTTNASSSALLLPQPSIPAFPPLQPLQLQQPSQVNITPQQQQQQQQQQRISPQQQPQTALQSLFNPPSQTPTTTTTTTTTFSSPKHTPSFPRQSTADNGESIPTHIDLATLVDSMKTNEQQSDPLRYQSSVILDKPQIILTGAQSSKFIPKSQLDSAGADNDPTPLTAAQQMLQSRRDSKSKHEPLGDLLLDPPIDSNVNAPNPQRETFYSNYAVPVDGDNPSFYAASGQYPYQQTLMNQRYLQQSLLHRENNEFDLTMYKKKKEREVRYQDTKPLTGKTPLKLRSRWQVLQQFQPQRYHVNIDKPRTLLVALQQLVKEETLYPPFFFALIIIIQGPAAATCFFGGGQKEVFLSIWLSMLVALIDWSTGYSQLMASVQLFLSSLLVAFFTAIARVHWYGNLCMYPTMLSALLWLLPGLSITNSIVELSARSMVSGTVRLVNALFSTLQMGFGLAIGMRLVLWATLDTTAPCINDISDWWTMVTFPLVSVTMNILLRAHPRQWFGMSLASAIALFGSIWLGKAIPPSLSDDLTTILCAFLIGIFSSLFSIFISSEQSIVYTLAGIIFLVPGSITVKGMYSLFSNGADATNFFTTMLRTTSAIAVGMLASRFILPGTQNTHASLIDVIRTSLRISSKPKLPTPMPALHPIASVPPLQPTASVPPVVIIPDPVVTDPNPLQQPLVPTALAPIQDSPHRPQDGSNPLNPVPPPTTTPALMHLSSLLDDQTQQQPPSSYYPKSNINPIPADPTRQIVSQLQYQFHPSQPRFADILPAFPPTQQPQALSAEQHTLFEQLYTNQLQQQQQIEFLRQQLINQQQQQALFSLQHQNQLLQSQQAHNLQAVPHHSSQHDQKPAVPGPQILNNNSRPGKSRPAAINARPNDDASSSDPAELQPRKHRGESKQRPFGKPQEQSVSSSRRNSPTLSTSRHYNGASDLFDLKNNTKKPNGSTSNNAPNIPPTSTSYQHSRSRRPSLKGVYSPHPPATPNAPDETHVRHQGSFHRSDFQSAHSGPALPPHLQHTFYPTYHNQNTIHTLRPAPSIHHELKPTSPVDDDSEEVSDNDGTLAPM